ncbi:glycosyltransferase [Paeniroseomonas aquatica]|uniref:Glycosyltransferase n=1 Tax=Paeniroseomonas aquatica TaxID=373043 RepID=A0ABT8ACQ2_9PROT|nr:glycosyltransferase [Paeniroseomonas aquatica]MDN3567531.1 glycosyltransferase [Paeniroseomonas aquatica]
MASLPWLLATICCALSLTAAVAAVVHAARVRPASRRCEGGVTLILPLAGPTPALAALFRALAAQTLRPRRLIVAVEGPADPAAAQALSLAALLPFPLQLAFAAHTRTRSHKCSNLIAGFRQLDEEDAAAVMLDADILPQRWWLSTLASPALEGSWDLVTGYRWPLTAGAGVLAQYLAWLDRGFAVLPKFQASAFAWGGSLAFSRRALAVLDVPAVLDRVLSDDLAIGTAARRAGLRVLTRRILLLPTPPEGGVASFMRRQMRIVHLYRPLLFHASLLVFGLDLAGWVALLGLAAGSGLAQGLVLGLLALRLLRWGLQDRLGRLIGAPEPRRERLRQLLVALTPPVGTLVTLVLLLQAVPCRRLSWRHVSYALDGPDRVRVLP